MSVEAYLPQPEKAYVRLNGDMVPTEFWIQATLHGANVEITRGSASGVFSQTPAQIRQFAKALLAMVGDD